MRMLRLVPTSLLVAALLFGWATAPRASADEVTIQKVIDLPGISKGQIYDKSRIWIAKNFRSSKSAIEYENRETGVIVGKGIIIYPVPGSDKARLGVNLGFNMKEDIKDNKMRVTYENLTLLFPANRLRAAVEIPVSTQSDIDAIQPVLLGMADEMAQYVQSSKDKDNW